MSMENQLNAAGYGSASDGAPSHPTAGTSTQGPRRVPSVATGLPSNGTINPVPVAQPTQGRPVVPRSATAISNGGTPSPTKRARKDRGPNWSQPEIAALVTAKRDMFLEELDVVDGRDLMNPDASKWIRVSIEVMRAGFSPCPRDGPACKSKWNQIIPDYKRVADFFTRSGTNGIEYWNMTASERKNEGLPRSFSQNIFNSIHEWFGNRPSMQPPHTRDLLSMEDSNYSTPADNNDGGQQQCDSDPEDEDPMNLAEPVQLSDNTTGRDSLPLAPASTGAHTANASFSSPTTTPSGAYKNGLPPGVTPVVVSSSDTSAFTLRRREGNTAVRRKHLSGHNVIAEATKASGEVMAGQMRDMAEASRDLERSKIHVQLKLFSEQMEYQRERDRRLHENARLANMNARLAIEKQGQVVKCLSDLSNVLSAGLRLPKVVDLELETEESPPDRDGEKAAAAVAALHLSRPDFVATDASGDLSAPSV